MFSPGLRVFAIVCWSVTRLRFHRRCIVLEAAANRVNQLEHRQGWPRSCSASPATLARRKARWQATRVRELLAERPFAAVGAFLRRRLEDWRVDIFPGARVRRL